MIKLSKDTDDTAHGQLWRKMQQKKRVIACTPRTLKEQEKLFLRVMYRLSQLEYGQKDAIWMPHINNLRGLRHMIRKLQQVKQ